MVNIFHNFNLPQTYLSVISGAVGTTMFQHSYLEDDNHIACDILNSGELSCAFFVTSILKMFDLISTQHATVASTLKDMESVGWIQIDKPRIGSVIFWEPQMNSDGTLHGHVGFCVGDEEAISNSTSQHTPQRHHITYGEEHPRKIISILWHKRLDLAR